jgi:hypothetical protein
VEAEVTGKNGKTVTRSYVPLGAACHVGSFAPPQAGDFSELFGRDFNMNNVGRDDGSGSPDVSDGLGDSWHFYVCKCFR